MMDFVKRSQVILKKNGIVKWLKVKFFSSKICHKELLFNEFLVLICSKNYFFADEINAFKRDFKLIQKELLGYLNKLVEYGYIDNEDRDVSPRFLYYNLLSDYMFLFNEDIWRCDAGNNLLLKIVLNGSGVDHKIINEKLDTHSAFTLLDLEEKKDKYNLFLCRKEDREKLLELVQDLNFPIVDV